MKVLNYIEEIILFVAFLIMTIIAFANIISRNIANLSLSFTEEITINLFVLLTFVGTAVGVRRYGHLGFTLIYDRMNNGLKKALIVFSALMGLILFGVLLWYGIQMVLFQMDMGQKTPSLGWPQWIFGRVPTRQNPRRVVSCKRNQRAVRALRSSYIKRLQQNSYDNDVEPKAYAKQQETKTGKRRRNQKEPDGLNPSYKVNIVSEGGLL